MKNLGRTWQEIIEAWQCRRGSCKAGYVYFQRDIQVTQKKNTPYPNIFTAHFAQCECPRKNVILVGWDNL